MASVDSQGRFIPTYPPADMLADPDFKERRYAPFTRMLAPENRSNLVQFLGGLGTEIDPRGAGGMIGRSVVNMQRQMDYQKATEKSIARNDNFMNQVFEMMSNIGLTPRGKKGGTKLEVTPNSELKITANLTDEPNETMSGGERVSLSRPRGGENTELLKKDYGTNQETGERVTYPPEGAPSTWDPADEKYAGITQTPLAPQPVAPAPTTDMPRRGDPIIMAPVAPGETAPSQKQQLKPGMGRTPGTRVPKMAPLPPRIDPETLPKPQTNLQSPMQPGAMLAGEGTAGNPMVIPSTTATAQREGVSQQQVANGLRSTDQGTVLAAMLAGYNPIQVQQPQYLTAPPIDTTVVGGGGFVAPPSDILLPTPRQRSQNIFDVRNFIPF